MPIPLDESSLEVPEISSETVKKIVNLQGRMVLALDLPGVSSYLHSTDVGFLGDIATIVLFAEEYAHLVTERRKRLEGKKPA